MVFGKRAVIGPSERSVQLCTGCVWSVLVKGTFLFNKTAMKLDLSCGQT